MRVKVTIPVDLNQYPRLTLDRLLYFIADSLQFEQAKNVKNNGEKINFSAGIFQSFWDWAPLATIYNGEIRFQVDAERMLVISRLSFVDTVLIASILVGLMAYGNHRIVLFGTATLTFYIVAWLGIITGNIFFAARSWRRFIQQCVRDAADRVYLTKEDLLAGKPSNA